MIEDRLPFGKNAAQRLMAVARWFPTKADHGQLLPPAWGTLYQLTKSPGQKTALDLGHFACENLSIFHDGTKLRW